MTEIQSEEIIPNAVATEHEAAANPRYDASSSGAPQTDESGLAAAAQFLRQYWLRVVAISAVVLAPCFWHQRIEAGDLASHTYNAWLAQLISRGQAPGLSLARQSSNILFDVTLTGLANLVPLRAAEKIIVAAAVLVFFWGAFALVCAITRRIPWFIIPGLAMFTYGWTLEQGFLNYYMSLGLAFGGLAIVHRGRGWERALAVALVPLIWMAHPLGLVVLVGVGAYLAIASTLAPRHQIYFCAASGVLLVALRIYLASRYTILFTLPAQDRYIFNGTDQLALYGMRYHWASNLFLILIAACLLMDVISRRTTPGLLAAFSLPLQLYLLVLLAAFVLPSVMFMPQYAAPVGFLIERLTSVSAILLCCLVGVVKPQRRHLIGFATVAAVFFLFLYLDTGAVNNMENQAERYERFLPPGQRIVATILPFIGSRININHIIDRACIGQCFSYGDYEPSTGQFRVRALPGNTFVVANAEDAGNIQAGDYVVQPRDLPMFQIYQCDLSMTRLCMRTLAAGEKNGSVGLHANH